MDMIMMFYQRSDEIILYIILLDIFICIICRKQTDIDEDMARRISASKPALAVPNFAGPKLHHYRSIAVDFCAQMAIFKQTIVWTIEKCQGKEGKNLRKILCRDAKSVISAYK